MLTPEMQSVLGKGGPRQRGLQAMEAELGPFEQKFQGLKYLDHGMEGWEQRTHGLWACSCFTSQRNSPASM